MTQAPDPRESVEITRVDKRGDYYTVEGVDRRTGKKSSAEVPAPSLEGFRTRRDAEAYMRRSIYGVSRLSNHPDHDGEGKKS